MRVLVEGSGGSSGWPAPGCRCASCLRAAAQGYARERSTIVVDGVVRLEADREPGRGNDREPGRGDAAGFRIGELPDARGGGVGGWDVTAPDGGRLLYPARAGAVPVPPEGAGRYDIAFLDMLGEPAQLGGLRARGLITPGTVTAVAFADHRVPSEAELRRRCGLWRVGLPGDGDRVTTVRSDQWVEECAGTTRRVPWRVLVMGGARSGKSERAELRLAGEPEVTYVATGPGGDGDPDWAARVAAHRARRPAWWRTVETTDLAGVLASARGAVLVDGIGTWLAAVLGECGAWDGPRDLLAQRTGELLAAWRQAEAYVVAVSDEAGLGVVPGTPAGRLFRDELGRLNQALAAESEEAELVVAGRVLPLAP
jgi:adenosylcobinamide kinase/adenosylcobinamide-phosphate guanylyltransferase